MALIWKVYHCAAKPLPSSAGLPVAHKPGGLEPSVQLVAGLVVAATFFFCSEWQSAYGKWTVNSERPLALYFLKEGTECPLRKLGKIKPRMCST